MSRGQCWEKKGPKDNILEAECLQCVKELNNNVDENAVAVVCPNPHCKKETTCSWLCATEISMIVSMFLSLPHCAFDSFATGKRDKHGGKYGLEIPMNFHFYGLQRPLNWLKREIKHIEESLNQTVNN